MEFELIKAEDGPVSVGDQFFSYARAQRAEKAERDPIVGDWVHFWTGAACWAALVTKDELDTVWLSCVAPGETSWTPIRDVPHIEEIKAQGSWHWPCGGH